MQVKLKRLSQHFVSFSLCLVLVLGVFVFEPPKASAIDPVITPAVITTTLFGIAVGMAVDEMGESLDSTSEYMKWLFTPRVDECKHIWKTDVNGYQYCKKCDKPLSLFYKEREQEYIDSLNSTTASSNSSEFATVHLDTTIADAWLGSETYALVSSVSGNTATVLGISESGDYKSNDVLLYVETVPFVWNYPTGKYDLSCVFDPYEFCYYRQYYGTYSQHSIYLHSPDWTNPDQGAELYSGYHGTSTDYADSHYNSFTLKKGCTYYLRFLISGSSNYLYQQYNDFVINDIRVPNVYVGPSYVDQPAGVDSSSRPADVMDMIVNHNQNNNYIDNSTAVNYYIGTVNDDGSVDKFFEPGVFDEETMIFTEPETGTEYQAIEWEYNYETRTYGIGFEDGVLSVDGQAANIVLYILGDDACVLSYYNGETLVKQVSYNYLMASQSICNISGHTVTYETTKEPTCTSVGERKGTCTVCGNEVVEEIAPNGHTVKFTVVNQATCISQGLGLYTCSVCGSEYTEAIPKTEHTSVLVENVPTKYDENGVVITPGYSVFECSFCGTQYTEYDDVSTEDEAWYKWVFGLFKGVISSIFNGLSSAIDRVFDLLIVPVMDWLTRAAEWVFSLFDTESLDLWFNWFEDGSALDEEFAQYDENGNRLEVDVWA